MKIFTLILFVTGFTFYSDAQNVGIGTDDPEMPLHVEGGIGTGLRITRAGVSTVKLDFIANVNEASLGTTSNHGIRFLTNNSVRMDLNNLGNVSIGSINGPQKLNVNGAVRLGSSAINSSGSIRYFQNDFQGYNGSEWLSLTSGGSGSSFWLDTDPDGIHYDEGNVGIGTTPRADTKLFINGATKVGGKVYLKSNSNIISGTSYLSGTITLENSYAALLGGNSGSSRGIQMLSMGEPILGDYSSEINVFNNDDIQAISLDFVAGKGTVVSERLEIKGAGSTDVNMQILSELNNSAELRFLDDGATRIRIRGNEGSTNGAEIQMFNMDDVRTIEIDADFSGKGRITTDEILIKGGSDFAENFDIVAEVKPLPGMVVSIDPDHAGKLMLSQTAYDTKVAGIVSGANGISPGMMMGQENSIADGEYPVALSGRVYAYASIEGGAIKPGDLLTTAAKEGHVMKVNDVQKAQGAIIGKAMTHITEEGKLVLVLVNLH